MQGEVGTGGKQPHRRTSSSGGSRRRARPWAAAPAGPPRWPAPSAWCKTGISHACQPFQVYKDHIPTVIQCRPAVRDLPQKQHAACAQPCCLRLVNSMLAALLRDEPQTQQIWYVPSITCSLRTSASSSGEPSSAVAWSEASVKAWMRARCLRCFFGPFRSLPVRTAANMSKPERFAPALWFVAKFVLQILHQYAEQPHTSA